ncbi:MAG: TonB-dependent receptor [Sphingomonadales bacterium 32-68-7]|nr:MAG: TonB-dependent receptor [Sphingomonadales bacterium 32-68-7]
MIKFRQHLFTGVAALAVVCLAPQSAVAQQTGESVSEDEDAVTTSNQIVVQADIGYRNRVDEAEPVLVYDEEYFQRFEPLTAGDALKRVPSVTFLSDVIESDGPRLRGLDSGYTQILINGEKVPGPNPDRSFFLDRIPAELIDRVEIVRSSSARRTGDAVAGTLNIVLRDAFALDGGYLKGGALRFDDGEIKPTAGLYYGGALGPGRVLLGANVQGRYNPKLKESFRYGDSPENNPDFLTDDFDNREDQTDTRDGWDYALNGSWGIDGETTEFEISGNFVRTDRTENERSFEYNVAEGIFGPVAFEDDEDPGLLTDNYNVAEIQQESYAVAARLEHEWALGETTFKAGYAAFDDTRDEVEVEVAFDTGEEDDLADPEWEGALVASRNQDTELTFQLDHEVPLSMDVNLVFGGLWQDKTRDTDITEAEQGDDLADRNWDQFEDSPVNLIDPFEDFEPIDGGLSEIQEKRRDAFALVEGDHGALSWEAGVRYETTKVEINDFTVAPALASTEYDYEEWLPSASIKIDIGDGRLTASGARTLRRPQFDFLTPVTLEEELGDHDLRGNPLLQPETAWGGDLGYEHRLGRNGVIGVNVFYRKIEDLVEIVNTGDVRIEDEGGEDEEEFLIFQPQNVGSGEVYGIEFDLSTDLGFLGLPDTGVFGNVSLLDSEITDFLGSRKFNDQSDNNFTIRAVGSNLLDGKKSEVFNKFDTVDDQEDRDFDEYELESERAGPVFQLVGRLAF